MAQTQDSLQLPQGLITRLRAKKFKQPLNGLIQALWAESSKRPNHGLGLGVHSHEDQVFVNLIQVQDQEV